LTIENLSIKRDPADVEKSTILFLPIYLQNKTFTMKNLYIQVVGSIMFAYDPLNIHFENLDIDIYAWKEAVRFEITCNYPEAALDTVVIYKNITAYNSQERI
jgi:hypothetical protein